jgi:formate hydrogenlyase subunit 3/multisubunit Na+/H+ antiporter MnhD subunit
VILPAVLFLSTLVAMVVVGIVRRHHFLAALISGIITGALAAFILFVPLDEVVNVIGMSIRMTSRWQILGRSFILSASNRSAISYLYLAGGLVLSSTWLARPTRMYFPLSLGVMGLMAASLMIEPFLFAAIFFELAAIVCMMLLSSRETGQARGGLRLLSLYTIAMMIILIVGWVIDVGGREAGVTGMSERVLLLFALGFAILMAVPPFHSWLPIASGETHPFAIVLVVVSLQGAGMLFFMRFLQSFSPLGSVVYDAIRFIGALMALVCSIWAFSQSSIEKIGAYAIAADIGVTIIAIGVGNLEGNHLALGLFGARVVSMVCWAIGCSLGRSFRKNRSSPTEDEGITPMRLARGAALLGLLSFAGFPLTAGFPGRWGILNLLAPMDTFSWLAILVSSIFVTSAAFRSSRGFLYTSGAPLEDMEVGRREGLFLRAGIAFIIIIGLFPQLLFPWIARALVVLSP